jgi:cyclic pyranopterin phosphate synthase
MKTNLLSHIGPDGTAQMVNIGEKEVTFRRAVAKGGIQMAPATLSVMLAGELKKGDALSVARIAGIQGAKETSRSIPMCHPLSLTEIEITFEPHEEDGFLSVSAAVSAHARTGVEMEALTAVSIACLTLYDMAKSVDKKMVIQDIRVIEKSGGKSGSLYQDPMSTDET